METVGSFEAKTASGDVEIEEVQGDARVKTASGDVSLESVGGQTQIQSTSGDVALQQARGEVVVQAVSGDLWLRDAGAGVHANTVSGDLRLEAVVAGVVEAQTVSGDVYVAVRRGSRVYVDATTISGSTGSEFDLWMLRRMSRTPRPTLRWSRCARRPSAATSRSRALRPKLSCRRARCAVPPHSGRAAVSGGTPTS